MHWASLEKLGIANSYTLLPHPPTAAKRARASEVDLGEIIEITCNDRLGKKIRIKCHENALIIDVKKLAAAQLGTRPEKIRFQKWHSIMKDHIRLSDYEVREGANIELYYQ